MTDTIREKIIQDLKAQLEKLTEYGGANSGRAYGDVYRGRTYFAYDEIPAMSIIPGMETAERDYGEQKCTLPLSVHAVQVIGDNEAGEVAELVIGDLIDNIIGGRANISLVDDIRYTGGGVESWPGADEQSISVQINIELHYSYNIGDPYTQTTI